VYLLDGRVICPSYSSTDGHTRSPEQAIVAFTDFVVEHLVIARTDTSSIITEASDLPKAYDPRS
jgi:hypothetical protein